jgi:protein subunit release factor B
MNEQEFAAALRPHGLHAEDFEEQFVRSSGPGGQNVNKVATAVLLRHRSNGLSVRAEEARTQGENRKIARQRLIETLDHARAQRKLARQALISKKRRQAARRSPAQKRAMVENKRHRSHIKSHRGKVRPE